MAGKKFQCGLVCLVALTLAGGAYLWPRKQPPPRRDIQREHQQRIESARRALDVGRIEVAEGIAAEFSDVQSKSAKGRLLLAEIAMARNDSETALRYFDSVPMSAESEYVLSQLQGARICWRQDRLREAERRLRRVLEQSPSTMEAHRQLARLLTLTGRRRDAARHLEALVRANEWDREQLMMLADPENVIDFSVDLKRSLANAPTDPLPRIGLARIALHHGDLALARTFVDAALRLESDSPAALATLGWILFKTDEQALESWRADLPPGVERNPEILEVLGFIAASRGRDFEAIRCFGEIVRQDPNHRPAVYRIGQIFARQGESERSRAFLNRAVLLDHLVATVNILLTKSASIPHMRRVVELCEQLGRRWEAQAWYDELARSGAVGGYASKAEEVRVSLGTNSPFCVVGPELHIELPSDGANDTRVAGDLPHRAPSPTAPSPTRPRFRDIAADVGLRFTYDCGDDTQVPGWEVYQELGGGVGVLDFDRDGWPDLYLPQGCAWPPATAKDGDSDRLFQNRKGATTRDVTTAAGIVDHDFGQGASIGDWDDDGFPDIYVANLGVNRLYRNSGDGTFQDVTRTVIPERRLWTTSTAIADLNGDGWPDLFDVTYLAGDAPLDSRCVSRGIRRACSPDLFSGDADRVFLNQGNGGFRECAAEVGITGENGKGLGVVVADFEGQGRVSVFVANDGTPNFYYVNRGRRGEVPQFVEQGVESGVAFDAQGRSQACMGVAFGALTPDGPWNLFVTNFFRESNTLYRMTGAGLFEDVTRTSGLAEPSFSYTGFGTQFIDSELDGNLDLVVLNGHIEDFRYKDIPFQMRAQYFRHHGGGRFTEETGEGLGEYFQRRQLGRALATLDWDRDGSPDLLATHLELPIALLRNETPSPGKYLKVRLVGAVGCRDGLGATVRVVTDSGYVDRKQVVAGDGFQASNERVLHFGLGNATSIRELAIRWPAGREHVHRNLECDRELIIRETGELFVVRP